MVSFGVNIVKQQKTWRDLISIINKFQFREELRKRWCHLYINPLLWNLSFTLGMPTTGVFYEQKVSKTTTFERTATENKLS